MRAHPANVAVANMVRAMKKLPKADREKVVSGAIPLLELALGETERDLADIRAQLAVLTTKVKR